MSDNYLLSKGLKKKTINFDFPTTVLFNNEENMSPDIVICCYGGMVEDVIEASFNLLVEDEITTKLFIPTQISPIDSETVNAICSNKSKLILVEEGYSDNGWCSQLVTHLIQNDNCNIKLSEIKIIGPRHEPIPANMIMEKHFFPNSCNIVEKIRSMK